MVEAQISNTLRIALLLVSSLVLAIGTCGNPMVVRLYFVKGGKRIWFSSFLQSAGFPLLLIPLCISYFNRRRRRGTTANTKLFLMTSRLFLPSIFIGLLIALDNYFYAYGVARLPVSTAAIVVASQLGFTAMFAFLIVKQKFSAYSVNAIVLLTLGSGVLALHTSSDRPEGETTKLYVLGFIMTLAAAALYGLVMPLTELMLMKGKAVVTLTLVLEIQLVMSISATILCTVGMLINHDFQAIPREARAYEIGEANYYQVAVWNSITGQMFFLGVIGVISCSSSLLSGIIISVLLPVTEVLAVIFFNEKFQAEKGVALVLSLWGFVSYFYGEIKHNKKKSKEELPVDDQKNSSQSTEILMVTPIVDQ
ncbi:OLC1v1017295C1 [Oldenlandia corymbosa var. corymbosa]|uniref:Probable purine permease n=1 Tax=Oldenlandia corymbosa var. corymbosa TaxID=529605 RepID=A0AAV1E919_OLDCO|nr:OLC1v1017295C1 [Oldenlandia corymbosa var. corymbosa]